MAENLSAALLAVLSMHPYLTWRGFESPNGDGFEQARQTMMSRDAVEQFERAVAWLSRVPKRTSPNHEHGGSYGLKHAAEQWAGDYIGNGCLIAAAIHLGFPMQRVDGSPNAVFGVSAPSKWPTGKRTEIAPIFA